MSLQMFCHSLNFTEMQWKLWFFSIPPPINLCFPLFLGKLSTLQVIALRKIEKILCIECFDAVYDVDLHWPLNQCVG